MRATVLGTLLLTALTATATAAPAPSGAPRPAPRATPGLPSYAQKVEPAVIGLDVRADPQASSSRRLGERRTGRAVLFDARGYAVTVSYLLLDALRIEGRLRDGRRVPARLVGLDLEAGLGVVALEGAGPWPAAALGSSLGLVPGAVAGTVGVDDDNELVVGGGRLEDIRPFSAPWEYMLDRALIVAPSSRSWGGSAAVDEQGGLVGIVSLRLGEPPHVSLAIPIEKFASVKDELVTTGTVASRRPRPWLGLYTVGAHGALFVQGVAEAGPAAGAGFRRGDRIVRVNGVEVQSQEEFYAELWRGQAGDLVQVAVLREGSLRLIEVRSADRARRLAPAAR